MDFLAILMITSIALLKESCQMLVNIILKKMLFIYLFVQQIFLKHLWCVWFCVCTGTAKDLGVLCLFILSSLLLSITGKADVRVES